MQHHTHPEKVDPNFHNPRNSARRQLVCHPRLAGCTREKGGKLHAPFSPLKKSLPRETPDIHSSDTGESSGQKDEYPEEQAQLRRAVLRTKEGRDAENNPQRSEAPRGPDLRGVIIVVFVRQIDGQIGRTRALGAAAASPLPCSVADQCPLNETGYPRGKPPAAGEVRGSAGFGPRGRRGGREWAAGGSNENLTEEEKCGGPARIR